MKNIIVLVGFLIVSAYVYAGGGGSSGGKGGGGEPTTTYKNVQIYVTYYPQETTTYCGMASMQMYLDYLFTKKNYLWDTWNRKKVPSQWEIWSQSSGGYWANYPSALNYYLSFAGYGPWYTTNYIYAQYGYNQLDNQKRYIDNGEVCITGFGLSGYGNDHAVLMFGYEILSSSSSSSDIRTIYYHDPWYGANQTATLSIWDQYTLVNNTYRTSVAKRGI